MIPLICTYNDIMYNIYVVHICIIYDEDIIDVHIFSKLYFAVTPSPIHTPNPDNFSFELVYLIVVIQLYNSANIRLFQVISAFYCFI